MLTFSGKTVLVTGGTGDLGQALLRRLRAGGLRVAFTYHRQESLAGKLEKAFGAEETWALPWHSPRLAEAQQLVKTIQARWGEIHYLVNNAGVIRDRALANMDEEEWNDVLQTNLTAVFAVTRACIFNLLKRPGNAMVNISSVAALTGASGQSNYAAAKAGLLGFTRSLAREYGRLGLRVNALAPGYVASRMTDRLSETVKARALKLIPLQRFALPQEVAAAAAFLLSDQAGYIQGQVLAVDGGLSI
ncbi:MAG: SDR family oxidoreductase [Candidatus Firestonebacteria bacterium]|nr:SDR family oxidoreductase [Candidatus Firestonebacteria bacterium]